MTAEHRYGQNVFDRLLRRMDEPELEASDGHRSQARRYLAMAVRILSRLNTVDDPTVLVQGTEDLIKGSTDIEEVKIHLLSRGTPPDHRLMGICSSLSLSGGNSGETCMSESAPRKGEVCVECMFATVVSGRTRPSLPYFTEKGSFWVNSRNDLRSAVAVIEPARELERDGCESVALIPLRSDASLMGLLELRDRRPGMLSQDLVDCLEETGARVAVALERIRASGRLRDSEAHYRALFGRSTSPILVIDSEGNYVDCNQAASQFLECERNQLLEKNLRDFAQPEKGEEAFDRQVSQARSGEMLEVGYQVSGRTKSLELSVTPMIWHGRQIVLQVGKDVTERKRAEKALRDSERRLEEAQKTAEHDLRRAEEKYRDLVENLNETIYAVDLRGIVTYVSPVIETILEYDAEDVAGKPFAAFIYGEDLGRCEEDFRKTLSGECMKGEFRVVTRSGGIRWVRTSSRPIFSDNRVVGARGVLTDVTDAKRAESRIRESEENYRTIVDLAPDGIITLDLKGNITSCNPAFLKLYGHAKEDIVGKHFSELPAVKPGEIAKYTEMLYGLVKGKSPSEMEIAWSSPDGRVRYAEIRTRLLKRDGAVVGIQCVTRDITERKVAEQELRKSEAQYRNLVESMNDGLAIQDDKGFIAYANDRFCEMLGFPRAEVVGKPLSGMMDKENLRIVNEQTAKRKNGKRSSYELSWRKRNGQIVNTLTSGSPIRDREGRLIGSFGVITDITDRKRAEKALRESEEKLRAVFESVVDGIVVLDLRANIVELNESLVRMFGYEHKSEALGRNAFEFIHESHRDRALRELSAVFRKGPVADAEYTFVRRDGSVFPGKTSASVLKGGSGRPSGFVAVVEDIAERKKAEEEIRKFKAISDRAGYGVLVVNLDGEISYVNDSFAGMLGYSREELIGRHTSLLYDEEHNEDLVRLLDLLEKNGKYVGEEVWPKRKDGSTFPALMNATLIRNDGGEPLLMAGTCVDITDRKHAEEEREKAESQLRQSQKMEALGTLAGGIAHDFNNLLTAIRGYTDLALMKMPKDDFITPYLSHIRDASTRAANLTGQLLMFSRHHAVDFRILDLNGVISNLLRMLNRLIGENYSIDTELSRDLWSVNGDSGHLEQVLMNIVVNAKDAMPEGGTVVIRTENLNLSDPAEGDEPSRFVCLSVRDSGLGMDEATLARIFEPFYSTKGAGKGTGIGLAVVYGIVKGHGGWIDVDSAPGEGTTFRIYLPAVMEDPEEEKEELGSLEGLSGSRERVLVVEDEDQVRGLAEGVLDENGYVVFLARNAEEALKVFRREEGNIDLVFSDVILPGRSGIEVVETLTAEKPGLRVLLASGYGQEDSNYEAIKDKGYPFLQKPYQLTDLLRAIRDVLGKD